MNVRCGPQLEHGSMFFGNDDGIQHDNFRPNPNALHCNMRCQGNPSELCGGPALLNLYSFTGTYPIGASVVLAIDGWTSRGCYRYGSAFTTFIRKNLPR